MRLQACWTADFETTTDDNDCRVWAFSMCNIADYNIFLYGNTIEEFFELLQCYDKENLKVWFHNLKFDGYFIISYLMSQGYVWIEKPKMRADRTFTTLITDQGQYYSITVFFKVKGHHTQKVTFYDSMKIFPNFSVSRVAEGFNLPIHKLEIDYKKYRPIGYELDEQEINYIRNDVEIMARALKFMFEQGHTKMTIASDAMTDFKHRMIGFRKKFPLLPLEVDKDIRESYRGGFTYVNDVWQGKLVGKGITLDVNSLYPSCMHSPYELPYGEPVYFDGKYEYDPDMPLYVQSLTCMFEIKEGKIPSIQLKNNLSFMPNEYVKSSKGRFVSLVLTSIDLALFFEQYNVYEPEYNGGWKFRQATGLFDDYVDHWIGEKIRAGREGNAPLKQLSKLLANSLYGRFGISGEARQKAPYLDEDGVVRFTLQEKEERQTCYIPVACFITSYGRNKTIRTSQAIRDYTVKKYGEDRYFYSDTDSIHANLSDEDLNELKDLLEIDDFELGCWAKEAEFTKAIYIRQKCYIEEVNGKVQATVAGLPKYMQSLITFDNFKRGFSTTGMSQDDLIRLAKQNGASDEELSKVQHKLTYKYVKGGVILADTDFTIK